MILYYIGSLYIVIIGLNYWSWLLVRAFMYWICLIGYGLEMLWLEWWYVYLTISILCSIRISIMMFGMYHLRWWCLCIILVNNVASSALRYHFFKMLFHQHYVMNNDISCYDFNMLVLWRSIELMSTCEFKVRVLLSYYMLSW